MNGDALSLIADELAELGKGIASQDNLLTLQGQQLATVAAKIEGISKTLGKIESLLLATLRDQANAENAQQARTQATDERFRRIENALKLRPA